MKHRIGWLLLVAFVAWLTVLSRGSYAEDATPQHWEQKSYVARGAYLVNHLAECMGCHTPVGRRGPDMSRYLSGSPAKFAGKKQGPPQLVGFPGPRGSRYYPKNITPDPETGIGRWSEDQFITAFQKTQRPDGTHYDHSEMPWELFKNMDREDIRAIYRYLRTVKPVKNKVPLDIPPARGQRAKK